jgi:hypothetical protein
MPIIQAQRLFVERISTDMADKSLDFIQGYVHARTNVMVSDEFMKEAAQLRGRPQD